MNSKGGNKPKHAAKKEKYNQQKYHSSPAVSSSVDQSPNLAVSNRPNSNKFQQNSIAKHGSDEAASNVFPRMESLEQPSSAKSKNRNITQKPKIQPRQSSQSINPFSQQNNNTPTVRIINTRDQFSKNSSSQNNPQAQVVKNMPSRASENKPRPPNMQQNKVPQGQPRLPFVQGNIIPPRHPRAPMQSNMQQKVPQGQPRPPYMQQNKVAQGHPRPPYIQQNIVPQGQPRPPYIQQNIVPQGQFRTPIHSNVQQNTSNKVVWRKFRAPIYLNMQQNIPPIMQAGHTSNKVFSGNGQSVKHGSATGVMQTRHDCNTTPIIKKRNQRNRKKQPNFIPNNKKTKKTKAKSQNQAKNTQTTPLLAFHKQTVEDKYNLFNCEDVDDDFVLVSGNNSNDSSESSDSEMGDSDSVSEESEISSVFSVNSVGNQSKSSSGYFSSISQTESSVSVFWDIENCRLPSKKSIIDFVSNVREEFYEGRTEVDFVAVCDVTSLTEVVTKELTEASVTLIHVSSINKNAADKEILSSLQKFQMQYRKSNSAVVLISSDSDFSQILLSMRYQHHIFVNLVCRNDTRQCLIKAANVFKYFEDIISKIPDRKETEHLQYVIQVINAPPSVPFKNIKNALKEKLKNLNCRVKLINDMVQIIFQDSSIRSKGLESLANFCYQGCFLHFECLEKPFLEKQKSDKDKKSKELKEKPKNTVIQNVAKTNLQILSNEQSTPLTNISNKTTLCVFVSSYIADTKYWKEEFTKIFSMSEFLLEWIKDDTIGYFLIHFSSLKKAQRAKKVLEKNLLSDSNAPKFFKIIKHNDNLSSLNPNIHSPLEESRNQKLAKYEELILNKKEQALKKHRLCCEVQRAQLNSTDHRISKVATEKLKELEEQSETFRIYTSNLLYKVRSLDISSSTFDEVIDNLLQDFTKEINCISSALPIYSKKSTITETIKQHPVLLICGESGSGKSTQLIQYILREKTISDRGLIICSQPRKVSTLLLAKYLSTEVKSPLGEIVGYHIGTSMKRSSKTKLLCVTDQTMINILLNEDLKHISCLIIDEAQERTVYTDILLSMMKKYLCIYPDLKLIITSTTNDSTVFGNYFNLTSDCIIQLLDTRFPVEDIWFEKDVALSWDYFNKSINLALDLLKNESGDILVFLASPEETERACIHFKEKIKSIQSQMSIEIFFLHDMFDIPEQQKLFRKSSNLRKVIFATSYAENAVTLPGVSYVIDCGIVREMYYDCNKKVNVSSVSFISKCNANYRRNKAGHFQSGKCYHLYSRENYLKMKDSLESEISNTDLSQIILKLLKSNINPFNPFEIEFIQPVPEELLNSAIDQLKYFKAVEETTLNVTELGTKMSSLPLESRLSHMVFQGFSSSVGYECLIIAAMVDVSRKACFITSQNKTDIKKNIQRWSSSRSDFLMYLSIYKHFCEIPKKSKSQWCLVNNINEKSMALAHNLIVELEYILQNDLKMKVTKKIKESIDDILLGVIFHSFSKNLAVFSGNSQFGYRSLEISDKLKIDLLSTVNYLKGNDVRFIIYDYIEYNSLYYVVNVSSVSEDIIKKSNDEYGLKLDLEEMNKLIVTELCINPLGEKILSRYFVGKKGSKRKEILEEIKKIIGSDSVGLDINFSNGEIKIFGYGTSFDGIQQYFCPLIEEARKEIYLEQKSVHFSVDNLSFNAVLASGGIIKDVILPGEFRDVCLTLKDCGDIETAVTTLRTCGNISHIFQEENNYKVIFENILSAKSALQAFSNNELFSLSSSKTETKSNDIHTMFKIEVSFIRRECLGLAFLSLVEGSSPELISKLNADLRYRDQQLQCKSAKDTQDIHISKLPSDTFDSELAEAIKASMPPGFTIKYLKVIRKKSFETSEEQVNLARQSVGQLFAEFAPRDSFEIRLRKPKSGAVKWYCTVYFKNFHEGESFMSIFKEKKYVFTFAPGLVLKSDLQSNIYFKKDIFSSVKSELEERLNDFQRSCNSVDIQANIKSNGLVELSIKSNNICDILNARQSFLSVLQGDPVESPQLDKLFTDSGEFFLSKVSAQNPECYIHLNRNLESVQLFGRDTMRCMIKMRINQYFQTLESEDQKDINLITDSGKTGVLRELFDRYGNDLQKFKNCFGISEIQLVNEWKFIRLSGSSSSIMQAEEILKEIKMQIEETVFEEVEEECPVCHDQISADKHILEYCGDTYCKRCLLYMIRNSKVPLKCEVCYENIVLADILWALEADTTLEVNLQRKFLSVFLKDQGDIRSCPAPGCSMIFRESESKENVLKCPACCNLICTRCEELYHYGESCSLHQCLKNISVPSIEAWMKEDPLKRKLCPLCSALIERDGLTNHFVCWKCKNHICWLCLQGFRESALFYGHQSSCPKRLDLIAMQ